MSLTDFAKPVIAPNAEETLRHVLKSGVSVINTAGVPLATFNLQERTHFEPCQAACTKIAPRTADTYALL